MAEEAREQQTDGAETEKSTQEPNRNSAGGRVAAQRAAKAAKKAAQRGTKAPAQDEVEQGVTAATAWYEHHQRSLWIAIVAALALGAGWVGVRSQFMNKGGEAAGLLARATETVQARVVADDEDVGNLDNEKETFASATARATEATKRYREVLAKYPDSTAALYARLGEANELLGLGQGANAEKLFARISDKAGDDVLLKWRALEGLGYALEAQNKLPDAVRQYEALALLQGGAFKSVAGYHLARIDVAQGNKDKALTRLEALIKAEKERASGENDGSLHFDSIVSTAEALVRELKVSDTKLRVDVPAAKPEAAQGTAP